MVQANEQYATSFLVELEKCIAMEFQSYLIVHDIDILFGLFLNHNKILIVNRMPDTLVSCQSLSRPYPKKRLGYRSMSFFAS
ncbi:hypothetical protein XELAEV_18036101mg [Xenopus laevis]|uniref:Uncharacterized protein n=1 Tax=Xenopus laevis TaxID=8355 RepID=A0A974CHN2_XENLA|nr:hypothetical protein XELAEV_18036101mg [Xenopus laevis]